LEKIDDVALNVETELHSTLNKKYPKYASTIPYSKDDSDSSISDIVKLNSLKNNIKDYMNSMIIQIHNDICEMTYKMSTTMAEKLINEAQHVDQSAQPTIENTKPVLSSNIPISYTNRNTEENQISYKKIAGGIKLPAMPANHTLNSINSISANKSIDNENGFQQKFEFINNSKSKRPTSSQLQDLIPTTTSVSTESKSKHSKSASSSSNENLVDIGYEEELGNKNKKIFSNSSSREKTPDRDDAKARAPIADPLKSPPPSRPKSPEQSDDIQTKTSETNFTPTPAPRKPKTSTTSTLKSLLRNVGGSLHSPHTPSNQKDITPTTTPSQVLSPKTTRKNNLSIVMETPQMKLDLEELNDETSQLVHINKSRPKRANVKKPTVKNPHSNIEIETVAEDLSLLPTNNIRLNLETDNFKETIAQAETLNEIEVKKTSPLSNKSNLLPEQPKINMNILESVQLRKTVKIKEPINTITVQTVEESIPNPTTPMSNNHQTATTPSSAPNKLGQRFSMFEGNKLNQIKKLEINQENIEENGQETIQTTTNTKITKPLPPLPPSKPIRPLFNQQSSINGSTNKPSVLKEDQPKPPAIMVKLRPVNGNTTKELNNENNVAAAISMSNSNENGQPEKRTSVKEIAQMLNEESKA